MWTKKGRAGEVILESDSHKKGDSFWVHRLQKYKVLSGQPGRADGCLETQQPIYEDTELPLSSERGGQEERHSILRARLRGV